MPRRRMFRKNPVTAGTHQPKKPIDPWYVTGFCDGECAFTYGLQSAGRSLTLLFNLKLHAQDRPLLEEIQKYFGGVGQIYDVKDPRPTVGPKVYFKVSSIHELQSIIRHFDKYPLRGWKARGYAIWRRMAQLKYDHYGYPPNDDLIDLAHELSLLNRRNATAWLRLPHADAAPLAPPGSWKAEDRRAASGVIHEEPVTGVTDQVVSGG